MPSKNTDNSVKYAGYLFILSVLVFAAVMGIAQIYFPCNQNGCYNIGTNPISDLGNTVLSPLWPLFNYGLVMFAMLLFAGIIFIRKSYSKSITGSAGMVFLVLSALGAIGVGTVPENTILAIHIASAGIAFFAGGIAILLIGADVAKRKGIGIYSVYSIISGIITISVFLAFTLPFGMPPLITHGSGLGFGAVERVIAAPLFIWILVTGIILSKRKVL